MSISSNRTEFDTDVIIVGAGPIGLTTACALRHHGVRCRIVEERTETKPSSRANNVWARPQELLASIGIRDALAEKSYSIKQVNSYIHGQLVTPANVDRVASPYPQVLYSGQDVIEQTLSQAVADRGSAVERGKKVVGIEQDHQGVNVTIADCSAQDDAQDPPTEQLRCRYLVGADGNVGTVRKSLGLDFDPEKFEGRSNRQIDAKLKWRRTTETDQLWFFYYHNGFCGILPIWGGYHRIFFLQDDAGVPDRDPTLEEMQAIAREKTGDDTLTLSDPIWFSHSRFKHGVAPSFASERVFLVGDAGHFTLPIGGQGMNAGFHDAISIAWRLAMSLDGRAEPVVLDSYDGERQGEHARLDDQQAQGFRNVVYRPPIADFAAGLAAKVVPNIGSLILGTDDLQQMSVSYPKTPLNEDHLGGLRELLHAHVPHPGDRAPDADVIKNDGSRTNLFPYIYNPDGRTWGWSLLAFDGRQEAAGPQLLAAVSKVAQWDWIRPRLILAAPIAPEVAASDVVCLSDLDLRAHSAYALDGVPALVLIRPDGHIAFRGSAQHPDLLEQYCHKVFGGRVG
jgi:3-(3-hydroxy-phenyl)propionate hydroxylase